jgi:HTH-type transcriptional regulator / antitoxin HigA
MEINMESDIDFRTPGQLIEKLLAERDWDQKFLAFWLGVSETIVSRMIAGTRAIDAEMAINLGDVFGIEPKRLLDLQQSYDLAKAELVRPSDKTRATKANLFGNLPVKEMIKRGWLQVDSIKNVPAVEQELKKFFGVTNLNEIELLPHAARKTNVVGLSTEKMTYDAQMAWIYRVKKIAEQMLVAPYSQIAVRRAIKNLEPLMLAEESVRKVPRILAEAGIRFVIVESVGPAKIDGVCLWLNDRSPVIGMTLRYDRIDNFWFVLRHELEHVDKLHGQANQEVTLDFELEGAKAGVGQNISEEERAANSAAANFGFTEEYLQKFISRKSPYFRELDIEGFANVTKVHPGIVVGRIQHATGRYDFLRKYLVGVRSRIAQSAMIDGWGNFAPVEYDE